MSRNTSRFAGIDESWEDLTLELGEIRDGDDRALALGRIRGRGRGSGDDIDVEAALVVRFREALITSFHAHTDRAHALGAVGLRDITS